MLGSVRNIARQSSQILHMIVFTISTTMTILVGNKVRNKIFELCNTLFFHIQIFILLLSRYSLLLLVIDRQVDQILILI